MFLIFLLTSKVVLVSHSYILEFNRSLVKKIRLLWILYKVYSAGKIFLHESGFT